MRQQSGGAGVPVKRFKSVQRRRLVINRLTAISSMIQPHAITAAAQRKSWKLRLCIAGWIKKVPTQKTAGPRRIDPLVPKLRALSAAGIAPRKRTAVDTAGPMASSIPLRPKIPANCGSSPSFNRCPTPRSQTSSSSGSALRSAGEPHHGSSLGPSSTSRDALPATLNLGRVTIDCTGHSRTLRLAYRQTSAARSAKRGMKCT